MDFYQEGPSLTNTFSADTALCAALERMLPEAVRKALEPGLILLGQRAAGEMLELADAAERQQPEHIPFDPWGRRIDEIRVSDAWKRLHAIAAQEGVVATAFEREHGEFSRLHQMLRLYLYHPSSAICSCPMAMTDGTARVLELYAPAALRDELLPRLTSRQPEDFWTAGQWMTERTGGSDVSGTSTVARLEGDHYRLYGDKWFTSATTSELAVTLARIEDAGKPSDKLSMFLVRMRDEQGRLQGIRVNRLKDKLGTRALPTAELTLDGANAHLLGEPGRGVRQIATVLNITRAYNTCCAVGTLGRGLMLARDYADKREAFGKKLAEHALHMDTLARVEAEFRAGLLLTLELGQLLGLSETGRATPEQEMLLRILTPVAKLYTGKQVMAGISEILESFGGAGYIEDTGLPVLLRDAQVLSIWEGTTNVLSLDLIRALSERKAASALLQALRQRCSYASEGSGVREEVKVLANWLEILERQLANQAPSDARELGYAVARCVSGVLLLEQSAWAASGKHEDEAASTRALNLWLESGGMPLSQPSFPA